MILRLDKIGVRHDREARTRAWYVAGREYYFCGAGCRASFTADPARYRRHAGARFHHAPAPADVTRSPEALGPRVRCTRRSCATGPGRARSAAWRSSRAADHARGGPNPELVDMTRRFWVSAVLTAPLLASRWARCCPASRCTRAAAPRVATGSQLALATPVVLWGGWPFFERGVAVAREPQPQHVHADRARRRRRLRLQRRRDARRPASFPTSFRDTAASVGRLLRGRRR